MERNKRRIESNRPDNKQGGLKRILFMLLVTAALVLFSGVYAMADDITFTVKNDPKSSSTFKIERSGPSLPAQTVHYRTVALSAFPGQHFNTKSGDISFLENETEKSITVTEMTPSEKPFLFQASQYPYHRYLFEVLDLTGNTLASCRREFKTGTSVPARVLSGTFDLGDERSAVFYDGDYLDYFVNDKGYALRLLYVNNSSFKDNKGQNYDPALGQYFAFTGARILMTLDLRANEIFDGYQYVQILTDNTETCDNRSNCSDGNPGNIKLSRYMAGFCHSEGKVSTDYANYRFPVTSEGNYSGGAGECYAWKGMGNNIGTLRGQKFNTGCRSNDGRLIIPADFNTLSVRLNASGKDEDDWRVKYLKATINVLEDKAPSVWTAGITVNPGPYNRGNDFYITVPFSECVVVTGPCMLDTSWGEASYLEGSGSNVLTFKGKITSDLGTTLEIKGFKNRNIVDLMKNSFSGKISRTFNGITSRDERAVTIKPGDNMAVTDGSGSLSQIVTGGRAIDPIIFEVEGNYYFPEDYGFTENGIEVQRVNPGQITVSGVPASDTVITLPSPSMIQREARPNAVFTATGPDTGVLSNLEDGGLYNVTLIYDGQHVSTQTSPSYFTASGTEQAFIRLRAGKLRITELGDLITTIDSFPQEITIIQAENPQGIGSSNCSVSNNDGKITGVNPGIEYRKRGTDTWTDCKDCTDGEITGLTPGIYYVRNKGGRNMLSSASVQVEILEYIEPECVMPPTFYPAPGEYRGEQTITVSCETEGAAIYYTLDGTEPTTESTLYEGPIQISENKTIKAFAVKGGKNDSYKREAAYTILPPEYSVTVINGTTPDHSASENKTVRISANSAPPGKVFDKWTTEDGVSFADATSPVTTFTMPGKNVTVTALYKDKPTYTLTASAPSFPSVTEGYDEIEAQPLTITSFGNADSTIGIVTLSGNDADSFILNKTDGATVTAGGTDRETYNVWPDTGLSAGLYTATVIVTYNEGATAKAELSFKVDPLPPVVNTAAMPEFSPAPGEYTEELKVTVSSETEGADIYYTTDGSTPSENSIKYTGPISVTKDIFLRAAAFKSGYDMSPVAEGEYRIDTEKPPVIPVFKDPVIKKKPGAVAGLKFNGKSQALVTAGEAEGGDFYYAVSDSEGSVPGDEEYLTSVPEKTDKGTYQVWYMVLGDSDHFDTVPEHVAVTISDDKKENGGEENGDNGNENENGNAGEKTRIDKVPLTDPNDTYPSSKDNFAPVSGAGKITKLVLDFSNVSKSDVKPTDLTMTVIAGSRLTTAAKVKDKGSVKTKGGIKAKFSKKTGLVTVKCKKDGKLTITLEDGNTYTVSFTVEKPKAQKSAKKLKKGSGAVTKTIRDLFGTDIDAGKLEILKNKRSQAALSGNALCVNPAEKDSIKVQYRYLNKKYKLTIKVK